DHHIGQSQPWRAQRQRPGPPTLHESADPGTTRAGVTETHSAHNAEAAGSNPAPATNKNHPPLPFAAPPHKGERRTESPAPTRSVGAGHLTARHVGAETPQQE